MLQHKIKLKKLYIHLFPNTHTRTHTHMHARTHAHTHTHSDTDTHMQTGTCAAHIVTGRSTEKGGEGGGLAAETKYSGAWSVGWEEWCSFELSFELKETFYFHSKAELLNFDLFCFDPFTSGEVYFRGGQFSSFKPGHNEMVLMVSFVIDMYWQVLRRTPLLYCGTCQREKLRPLSLSTQRR